MPYQERHQVATNSDLVIEVVFGPEWLAAHPEEDIDSYMLRIEAALQSGGLI